MSPTSDGKAAVLPNVSFGAFKETRALINKHSGTDTMEVVENKD